MYVDETPILESVFEDLEPTADSVVHIFCQHDAIPAYFGTGPLLGYTYRELVECVDDGEVF